MQQFAPATAIVAMAMLFGSLGYAIAGGSSELQRAPHGVLNMQAQKDILAKLLPKRDVSHPPASIDPGTWRTVVPETNRMTPQRVELGKRLFFDTRLSKDGTVACATCHDVTRGFTDQRKTSEGIGGARGKRNAPTTMNAFLMDPQFLDGRAPSLEEQAKLPIINPIEMGMPKLQAAVDAIKHDPEYQRLFKEAYGSCPNDEDLVKAIAAFERTLVFLDAPYDDFVAGHANVISSDAQHGLMLFYGSGCINCHQLDSADPLGTDNEFHNIGVSARNANFEALAREALGRLDKDDGRHVIDQLAIQTKFTELGRFLVTGDSSDIGAFKTSQLRNVGITPPYMHDGSMKTLWDVMDHYNNGGEPHPYLDAGMVPLGLSEHEIDAIVAFMFTLTDKRFSEQNRKIMEQQRRLAAQERPFRKTNGTQD